jgi:RNA polymerase subunit RPABC4/transcription elongation factor Spt4
MTFILCPYCLSRITENSNVCPVCESDVTRDAPIEMTDSEIVGQEKRTCPNCGHEIMSLAVICSYCQQKF